MQADNWRDTETENTQDGTERGQYMGINVGEENGWNIVSVVFHHNDLKSNK